MGNSRLGRTVLTLAGIALAIYIVGQVWVVGQRLAGIVSILAGAWFLAVLARPLVSIFQRRLVPDVVVRRLSPAAAGIASRIKLSFGLAVGLAYLFVLIVVIGILTIGVTSIVPQVTDFVTRAPDIYAQLPTQINLAWTELAPRIGVDPRALNQLLTSDAFSRQIQDAAGFLAQQGLLVATSTASFFGQMLLAFVLSLYITVEGRKLIRQLFVLLPENVHETTLATIRAVGQAFDGYLRGAVVASAIEAAHATLWMTVFGVPFALALGAFYFVLALIPLIGAPISFITILLVTLLFKPGAVLWILGLLTVFNLINAYVITPRLMQDAVGVPGLLGLLATSIGVTLFGFWGLLFGVPLVGATYALVFKFFVPRAQHERAAEIAATL